MINKSDENKKASHASAIPESGNTALESNLQNLVPAMTGNWMEKVGLRNGEHTVSVNELTSISALIAYVAHISNASEFRIERELADRFNVANVKCLPAARYDDAICYLVDRVPAAT